MRKVLALPLVAVALLIPAGLATAALDDAKGPTCADITDSDWFYNGVSTNPASGTTATVILFLDTASCSNISYTLVVQDSAADETFVNSNFARGDGDASNAITVTTAVPEGARDGEVCLYATTSSGRHVFDRAPDADLSPNCVELTPGGTGGGGGAFN
jgi:hypothetical protein